MTCNAGILSSQGLCEHVSLSHLGWLSSWMWWRPVGAINPPSLDLTAAGKFFLVHLKPHTRPAFPISYNVYPQVIFCFNHFMVMWFYLKHKKSRTHHVYLCGPGVTYHNIFVINYKSACYTVSRQWGETNMQQMKRAVSCFTLQLSWLRWTQGQQKIPLQFRKQSFDCLHQWWREYTDLLFKYKHSVLIIM